MEESFAVIYRADRTGPATLLGSGPSFFRRYKNEEVSIANHDLVMQSVPHVHIRVPVWPC